MKETMQEYREALAAVWGNDQGMIDYCVNQAAFLGSIRGLLFAIEKRKVDKHFCFGYSDCGQGQDYLTAMRSADYARHNADYFKRENLKYYTDWIAKLETADAIGLCETYGKMSPIRGLRAFRWWEVLEAVGGEATLEGLKGADITINGIKVYILTDSERQTVREAYEQAMKAQERKLDSYLKRYGLSKIKVWTYWIDE